MSENAPPIFPTQANAKLVNDIAPAKPDPRNKRVAKVHREIARKVKDGSIYRDR